MQRKALTACRCGPRGQGAGGHVRVPGSLILREAIIPRYPQTGAGQGGHVRVSPIQREALSAPRQQVLARADMCATRPYGAKCPPHRHAAVTQVRDRAEPGGRCVSRPYSTKRSPPASAGQGGLVCVSPTQRGALPARRCETVRTRACPRLASTARGDNTALPADGCGAGQTRACFAHTAQSAPRPQVRDRADMCGTRPCACLAHTARSAPRMQVRTVRDRADAGVSRP